MFTGYLALGCTEILSRARAFGYTRTADCPIEWLRMPECGNLAEALDEGPYDYSNIADAPWYDVQDEATHRFFGVYPTRIDGITDSTRTASIVEGISDGGVIAGMRHAVRTLRVQAILIGRGEDALEAGFSWLDAALAPESCSTHGISCGEVDATFFASCPPGRDDIPDLSDDEYQKVVDGLVRNLHGVVAVSGPLVQQKMRRQDVYGYLVEFTLAAGVPYVFSLPEDVDLAATTPVVLQDAPVNLVPYPSAELGSGSVVIATNHVTNPSIESDTSGWSASGDPPVSVSGTVVGARSTELAAVGVASYKVLFTATVAGTGGSVYAMRTTALPAGTGRRVSFNVWATPSVQSGTAVLGNTIFVNTWLDSGGASLGAFTVTGSAPYGAMTAPSVAAPDGATQVRTVVAVLPVSWAVGAAIRLYVDALAVTVP